MRIHINIGENVSLESLASLNDEDFKLETEVCHRDSTLNNFDHIICWLQRHRVDYSLAVHSCYFLPLLDIEVVIDGVTDDELHVVGPTVVQVRVVHNQRL